MRLHWTIMDNSLAERVGFEPTIPRGYTGFRDRRFRPLSHLSAIGGTCRRPPSARLAGRSPVVTFQYNPSNAGLWTCARRTHLKRQATKPHQPARRHSLNRLRTVLRRGPKDPRRLRLGLLMRHIMIIVKLLLQRKSAGKSQVESPAPARLACFPGVSF